MDMATLSVPPGLAREKFNEYRQAVKGRHLQEDELILKGYREIVRGRQVIDLVGTIKAGGFVNQSGKEWSGVIHATLPRLAIMRADVERCYVSVGRSGSVTYHKDRSGPSGREVKYVVSVPPGTLADAPEHPFGFGHGWSAQVPHIPPALRPKANLANYHILWEAEWSINRPPYPVDPALLKHIGGDLYVVLAVWDLTPLERTVLSRR